MPFDWGIGGQVGEQDVQASPVNYITKDDLDAYIRGNEFRSVMKNQNSDLYTTGEWRDFPDFEVFTSTFPFSASAAANLGASPLKTSRYTRIGNTIICTFSVRFGGGAPSLPGSLCFNLPVEPLDAPQFGDFPTYGASVAEIYPIVIGDIFVYGGQFVDTQSVGWLRAVLRTDPVTGASLRPARFFIAKGFNGEVQEELFSNGILLGNEYSYGDLIFPGPGAIVTGRIMYEVSPSA
jgi:hypothetical protein